MRRDAEHRARGSRVRWVYYGVVRQVFTVEMLLIFTDAGVNQEKILSDVRGRRGRIVGDVAAPVVRSLHTRLPSYLAWESEGSNG